MSESISYEEAERKIKKQDRKIKINQLTRNKQGEPVIVRREGNKEYITTQSDLRIKN